MSPLYEVAVTRPRIVRVVIEAQDAAEAEDVTRQAVQYALGMEMSLVKVAALESELTE